jgi:hypothetical protein
VAGETNAAPPPVIRKLPPVTFGAALAKTQPASNASSIEVRHAEALLRALQSRTQATTIRTICGLTMIEQSPDVDAGILMPPDDRSSGVAIRKIEPQICTPHSAR